MTARKVSPKKEEVSKEREVISGVLKSPCITEKSNRLVEDNFYTFKVRKDCNKKEIKKAIEGKYKVEVEKVTIVNLPRKKRFVGRKISGFTSGCKKAMVKLKQGQTIEIMGK